MPSATSKITAISLGPGCLLVAATDLLARFEPFGMTRTGFDLLLKGLGVPKIIAPDGTALVDYLSFQIAFRTISRIGQPDFHMPGAPHVRRGNYKAAGGVIRMDPHTLAHHWREILSELYFARRIDHTKTGPEQRSAYETAVRRMSVALASLAAAPATILEEDALLPTEGVVNEPHQNTGAL